MRLLICAGLLIGGTSMVLAAGGIKRQTDNRVPVRLQIRHADPWAVKALIEGSGGLQPELSTIWGVRGGANPGANAQGGNSPLLKDGYLVVNPTDNSLWWYPKKS